MAVMVTNFVKNCKREIKGRRSPLAHHMRMAPNLAWKRHVSSPELKKWNRPPPICIAKSMTLHNENSTQGKTAGLSANVHNRRFFGLGRLP